MYQQPFVLRHSWERAREVLREKDEKKTCYLEGHICYSQIIWCFTTPDNIYTRYVVFSDNVMFYYTDIIYTTYMFLSEYTMFCLTAEYYPIPSRWGVRGLAAFELCVSPCVHPWACTCESQKEKKKATLPASKCVPKNKMGVQYS